MVFGESSTVAIDISARKTEANRLLQQGLKQAQAEQFQSALQYFEQALIIFREIRDRKNEGATLGSIGLAYLSLGDYPNAIKYFQQVLAITKEVKDPQTEAKALGNIGLTYYFMGDYIKAIEYQQQLLLFARESKDLLTQASVLGHLGNAYRSLGNYPKAIEYQQEFLNIARQIKNREAEGIANGNIGGIYFYLGDYTEALQYFEQSLQIAREVKDSQREAEILGNIGNTYLETGDDTKAIEQFEQVLAIAKQIGDKQSEGATLTNLGLAYNDLGAYTKAIEFHQQYLQIARQIGDRQGEGIALGNIGLTHFDQGDYLKAIDFYQQALAITEQIGDRRSMSEVLYNLGAAYYKSSNLDLAAKYLSEGIKVLETLREGLNDRNKVSIFETQTNTYKALQQVLIAQNQIEKALEVSESSRARAFVDLLASKNEVNLTKAPTIQQVQQIAKSQNATLVQYSIINDFFQVNKQPSLKESYLYIWVVKPNGEVIFRKKDLKPLWQQQNTSLKDIVTSTRSAIGINDRAIIEAEVQHPTQEQNQAKSLQQLYQLLITPIVDNLPTDPNQHVIFIPQNELFLVPFAALQDTQGKYLVEKHTILTAPAIQVLELTNEQLHKVFLASVKDAIVVGNPTMPSVLLKYGAKAQKLPNLPGALKEAEAIAPLLHTKLLTGNEATKAAVLARIPKAKIIHLATHSLFDDFQGLQSAIALAPDNKDNGLLTAEEILNLKLNANLVVLSACNTGRGRITGDGVIGLSRSLISAGTPSVIVSLWSVPDAPTANLMKEFYINLEQQKLDKAQALRQAMLKMEKQYPKEPKKWAAFTLIGSAE